MSSRKEPPPLYPDQYSAQPTPPAPQPAVETYIAPAPRYRRRRQPIDDPGLVFCLILLAFIIPFWVIAVKEGCTIEVWFNLILFLVFYPLAVGHAVWVLLRPY